MKPMSKDSFISEMKVERETLMSLCKQYAVGSDEYVSLDLAKLGLLEIFAHDTEEEFMWNHYHKTPQKPKDGDTIQAIKVLARKAFTAGTKFCKHASILDERFA